MADKKFYTVEKEIGGVKYVAQFNGISAALEATDSFYIDGTGNVSSAKLAKYILSNVIVEPKGLTPDDFDTVAALSEVVAWGNGVMQGDFRPQKEEVGSK